MKAITVTVQTEDETIELEFSTYKKLVIWFAANKSLVSDEELNEIIEDITRLV